MDLLECVFVKGRLVVMANDVVALVEVEFFLECDLGSQITLQLELVML